MCTANSPQRINTRLMMSKEAVSSNPLLVANFYSSKFPQETSSRHNITIQKLKNSWLRLNH